MSDTVPGSKTPSEQPPGEQPPGEQPPGEQVPREQMPARQATESHGWWHQWIWSIPIAALGLVIWLAVRSWTQIGPEVTVTFPGVANLKPGDTKVQFEGMDMGEVESSRLEPDLKHVRATLRLHPDLRGHLGKGTQFWIIGKDLGLRHLSDLKALITGESVGISPRPGPNQNTYQGLAQPPVLEFGATGTAFRLHAETLGSIDRGTPVFYLGQQVGQVQVTSMTNGNGFDMTLFINNPYDKLVREGSRFWRSGPIHLSTGGNGPSLQFQSIPALFDGAISFETPGGGETGDLAPSHEFPLYDSENAAEYAPDSRSLDYRVVFHNVSSMPDQGAPVRLMGKRIGSVTRTSLQYDPNDGQMSVLATIALEPQRIALPDGAHWTDAREQMNDMLRHLIAGGMHAELAASPPVIGGQQVVLDLSAGRPGQLGAGAEPEIPSLSGGDIGGIMANVNDVTTKLDQMPLTQIADNLRDISRHLSAVTGSPEVARTLDHVDRSTANLETVSREMREEMPATLTELRRTVTEAQASLASARDLLSSNGTAASQPDTASLPQTLYEITRTARSLRSLSDLLDQHPSALLTGNH